MLDTVINFIKKNEKWFKLGLVILAAVLLFLLGLKVGRQVAEKNFKPTTVIEYVKGDTITDTVYTPKPVYVKTPADTADIIKACVKDGIYTELFPEKVVEKLIEVPTKEDTTAIIRDWGTKRVYEETLFDSDTLGTCKINAEVQYNRLNTYSYEFTPVIKQVTDTKYLTKKFGPFIGAGVMTNPSVVGMAGIFIDDKYGAAFNYQYEWELKKQNYGVTLFLKF